MRHLVVCCDGTWASLDSNQDGVPTPTNVAKIYNALEDGPNQLRYYHPGVGTRGFLDRFVGGFFGVGLSDGVKSAYSWLAANYEPGDSISLIGYSRGAYTVRSVVGMLTACGLARMPADADPQQWWKEIDRLYDEVYRPSDRSRVIARPHPEVSVAFLGVFDTVGALGVPDTAAVLNTLDGDGRHLFHDTRLSPIVSHARHALALDEMRGPYVPTRWTDGPVSGARRSIREVWFPGSHSSVGGGSVDSRLSDGALKWMIDEFIKCAGATFNKDLLDQLSPDPAAPFHAELSDTDLLLGPTPRAVPVLSSDRSGDEIHQSAFDRQARPPISAGPYRATTIVAVGASHHRDIYAAERWNNTGLYLDAGEYAFEASGEWVDRGHPVGPGGVAQGEFAQPDIVQLAGTIAGWLQERFRDLSGNEAATFFGSARFPTAPWMSLIGVVAAVDLDDLGTQRAYEPIPIGAGARVQVARPGYLYAYANDAWAFYDNNKGSVSLTVTRLS
jgi:hypothetical protein